MSLMKEFKQFAAQGNVIDLAVGVIIGGAFGKIVASAVSDLFTPVLGLFLGGINFAGLKLTIKDAVLGEGGKVIQEAVTLNYGNFLQAAIDFLILAWIIFLMIKAMNRLRRPEPEAAPAPAAPPEPPPQERLLAEIRDLLKAK